MKNSAKNSSEAPRSSLATRSSLDSSVNDTAYLLDQIRIECEKEESIEAAGTSLQGNSSQSFPANGSSNQTHQLGFEPDYSYRTWLDNPLLLPTPLYPTSIQTGLNLNNGDFGVNGSIPYSAWVNQNMPSVDMPSTSYSARQCDPFNGLSSLSSWAHQNGGNNSPIWGVAHNLMQTNLSMNNGFASESPQFDQFATTWGGTDNLMQKKLNNGFASVSPQIDQFAATWGGRNNLMQKNLNNGFASVSPLINQFAAAEKNGPFSISEWNRSSGIFGCLRNQKSYENGGQDGIQFGQIDMVQMANTEQGSKRLQEILAHKNERMTNMIFEKTLQGMLLIMNDKYGQFLFARLIDTCNPTQLSMIVAKITSRAEDLLETSCHSFGSQSIKRLIKVLERSPLIAGVTSALSCIFYSLMTHKTGSHAILKCFEVFTSQQNEVLHRKMEAQCIDLATHEIGCVSLNRSIQYIKGDLRYQLLHKISDNAAFLAKDPHGNFIMQSVIGIGNPAFTPRICSLLKGHYVELSINVGGSHVVEKCLTSRCPEMIFAVQDLLKYEKLGHVAINQYGNYVIQTALRETKRIGSPLHQELLSKIISLRELNHGYGKKVVNYIQRGCPLDK